jgi:hypothetical protein
MAGKRRHLPAPGERPVSQTSEIHTHEQEQTIRLDASRWAGFRDSFGEREVGVDEHGRSIELLRLKSPLTPLETALKARVGRLASFDNAGVGRALGVDRDERTGRLVLVSERVAGVRLSELLDRAFGRSLLPDLAAAIFVVRRLLAVADALHRETGIAHIALAPERVVVTPRSGVVLVELPLAGAIEGLARTEGGFPAELRLSPSSADATAGDPRLDIAHIATVGVSMILGRAFEPEETIDPLSPVLQEVEEVAAIRADQSYAFALRQWLDRAVTVDPELSFPTFRDAHLALDAVQPPADCIHLRPALARFVQGLALESVASAEATAIELERLRAVRVRQAASRVERPAIVSNIPTLAAHVDPVDAPPASTDDEFWRRAVAARFQMVRQQPADAGIAPAPHEPASVEAAFSPMEEPLRLVPPLATVAPADEVVEPVIEEPIHEEIVERVAEEPAFEEALEPIVEQSLLEEAVEPAFENASQPPVELSAGPLISEAVEPADSEETRLAWVRAVTQQLEASRSAERAHADVVQYEAPRVELTPEIAPEVAVPVEPEPAVEEVVADAQEPVTESAPALAIPTSRLAEEPTLAELHTLLTSVNEDDEEKKRKGKGSWLQAVKSHLRFTRRSSADEPQAEEIPAPPSIPLPDPAPAPVATKELSFEPEVPEAVVPQAVVAKVEDPPAAAIEKPDDSVDVDEVDDLDLDEVTGNETVQASPFEGLREREPSHQAWTAAVTSALSAPEPTPVPDREAMLRPPLEVVHPATAIDAPKPPSSTPVPRPAPAPPLPDFEEESRRGVPRWAIWAGLAVAVVGGGGYLYSTRSADSPPAEASESPAEAPGGAASTTMGSLSITSNPPGATVTLDGTERGVTPLKLSEIAAGTHRLQLRGEGGVVNRTVAVKAGEESLVDEAIFSGWVAVFAPFELQIFAGGKQIGTTGGSRIMLPAGPHDVQLVNARLGYRQTHKIDVRPGEVSALNISAPEGSVQVNAPADAELFVDGLRAGKGSGELRVPIGTREVLVRHAQGEHKVLVTVTLSEPAVVTVPTRP